MSLNASIGAVARNLRHAFDDVVKVNGVNGSPQSKKSRKGDEEMETPNGSGAEKAKRSAGSGSDDFVVQKSFLQRMMEAQARVVDEEMSELRGKAEEAQRVASEAQIAADSAKDDVAALKEDLAAEKRERENLRAAVQSFQEEVCNLRGQCKGLGQAREKIDKDIKALQERPVPAPAAAGVAAASSAPAGGGRRSLGGSQDLPYEQRTVARIGALGWDLSAEDLVSTAKAALLQAGVDPATYMGPTPVLRNNGGSGCDLAFRVPSELQMARAKVAGSGFRGKGGRFVWLDAKNTRAENKPTRCLHRAAEVLTDVESRMSEPLVVHKKMEWRIIQVGDNRAFATVHGVLQPFAWARSRYGEDDMQVILGFANEE